VSIELPKYSIQETHVETKRFKKFLPVILFLLGLIAGCFGYIIFSKNSISRTVEKNQILEQLQTTAQQKVEEMAVEISQLKAENTIKNEAVKNLQNDFKTQLDIQNNLESEISFYQQLLSPNSENKGLRVFDNNIFVMDNNNYRLEATLVQKIQKASIISGSFEISVIGKQEDVKKTISIDKKDDSKYEFKYFQKISLGFSLPKGFKAEQLVVELFPQNKKSKSVKHNVNWASHLK